MTNVGIAGIGLYLPEKTMSAKEIAEETKGRWTEEAVREKLGINQIYLAGEGEGTQEMGALAALDLIENTGVDPKDIDVILCFGEEWKEYPLTTSAIYIQDRIGAENAWGIDVQNRCCTTVTALKMAKDMLVADEAIDTILIAGGYRNGDLIDYSDPMNSMMYNLSAGGGALLLKKNHDENLLLGSHIISDGSLARTAGVEVGGIENPYTAENVEHSKRTLKLLEPVKMKERLNDVSMINWMKCIDHALEKSEMTREDIDYLDVLHMKRSGHRAILEDLDLTPEQTVYLEDYGHLGQIDQILSLKAGLEQGKIREGTVVCSIAAGIGYVWAADIIKWGKADG
ncbi:3-oxoacyl-[acyl-carrier-protein] synthase-3 [Alkalibacterium subtropicum]|uniref:3-oxoacyl-[acyl-carrier-protein] synthase-3 n=1 Tax=Alkalibacterium subtropicum TaxID=753702 RepID=A0A1I1GYQ4_9LACT|nr:3-oxoacyl-ACP synthase [Alkalibacterium subtropicum]SFC16626.1 3-oxoacyl-[acyl-carrier-protein] synthase-3 [Alkalibacterium subtropicum]